MARGSFWLLFATSALALAGGAYLYAPELSRIADHGSSAVAATPEAEQRIVVEVQPVTVATVTEDIRAVGTLRPNESVIIAPEIAGRLLSIHFEEGNRVAAGDVLVELDPTILRAELAKARSDLSLARANNERAATLAQQGTGTLRARDEAVAAFMAAQAEVSLAEARLEKATITAPLSGVVGLRPISVGAYLIPGTPIVELAEIDLLKVDLRVPELQLANLRPGQPILITADAIPDTTFEGTIYAIDPIVDINGRAIRLRARVPNPDGRLFPGLFTRIRIIVSQRPGALLVPEAAIVTEVGRTFVYRVVDGLAARVEVSLGQRGPGAVEVTAGLRDEDVVVTAGHQRLREGAAVEIVAARPGT